MDKIGEMKDEFPALYSTAERHYQCGQNNMWDPQLGDGNYRTVQPWKINRAFIPEKSEINDETGKKDGRGIIIDNQTGVIHIDRF